MKWIKNKPTLRAYILQSVIAVIVFALVLVADLVTKAVTDGIEKTWVIEDVFSITSRYNTGGAWNMFGDNPVVMNIIKAFTFVFIAVVLVVMFWPDSRKNMFLMVTTALLGSGALGNLIDRLAFGYVRDFLSFDLINFPVFNVADVALVTGVIMLIVFIVWTFIKTELEERKNKTDRDDPENNGDGAK